LAAVAQAVPFVLAAAVLVLEILFEAAVVAAEAPASLRFR